ncbi:hypothetical protein G4B88_014116 [Cannabis sativa]|uniref:GDSL esterase/lipase n=1 Tax=Cannabis sativa TaxID=3483 RepID=A0A7J6I222_CANSA|nr:hypothetical protein G4B88_014116 [Cannabis sativa]
MNFAFGGTGVFDTMEKEPNMSTQINFFEDVLRENDFYSKQDLNSSLALVSIAGNDYGAYLSKASSSFQNCSQIFNSVSDFHNQILHQKLQALNNQTSSLSNSLPVLVLDLYTTFMSAFENLKKNITATATTAGNLRVESPLIMKPCCVGISKEYSCGSLDENGAKKYSIFSS